MKAKRKPATKANRLQNEIDSDAEFYRKLGEAFWAQESDISDLLTMSTPAARASVNGAEDERIFTAHHLLDMIEEFKRKWHAQYDAAGNAVAEASGA